MEERESGTMHTVEYAKQQYRRLACYCNALFAIEKATGNQYIQENSRAQIINNTNGSASFYRFPEYGEK